MGLNCGLAFKTVKAAADPGKDSLYAIFSLLFSEQPRQRVAYFQLAFLADFVEFQGL